MTLYSRKTYFQSREAHDRLLCREVSELVCSTFLKVIHKSCPAQCIGQSNAVQTQYLKYFAKGLGGKVSIS